eukprot:m.189741 g.189741  ORF g.189741 m.189741 type:complete len:54 (+) comp25673_c0_seq7:127-288(+)
MEYVSNGPLQRHLTTTLEPSCIVDWSLQIARVSVAFARVKCVYACVSLFVWLQ